MQGINIWRKLNIYWYKIVSVLFVFTIFYTNDGMAQHTWDTNLPNYDERFLHYGFTIGINSTRFRPVQSDFYFNDTISKIKSAGNAGFSLGFVVNARLSPHHDLRLLPTVAFYQRNVQYTFQGGSTSNQNAESVFVEFPLLLKYKSERRKNNRMYMIAGLKAGIEAGAKKKEKRKSDLRTNNFDLAIEYGFGLDNYFKYFKFAPELRFSHGIINLLNRDPNIYSQSLMKLTTHTVTLYLHFE
jgi:hypothetical protein